MIIIIIKKIIINNNMALRQIGDLPRVLPTVAANQHDPELEEHKRMDQCLWF